MFVFVFGFFIALPFRCSNHIECDIELSASPYHARILDEKKKIAGNLNIFDLIVMQYSWFASHPIVDIDCTGSVVRFNFPFASVKIFLVTYPESHIDTIQLNQALNSIVVDRTVKRSDTAMSNLFDCCYTCSQLSFLLKLMQGMWCISSSALLWQPVILIKCFFAWHFVTDFSYFLRSSPSNKE